MDTALANPEKYPYCVPEKRPGAYEFTILGLLTLVRSVYAMNVSSIGYVYGFQGTGFKANNPKYELLATFPNLAPIYGVVASLLFGVAYSTSNMVVAGKTKKVNPKTMLLIGMFSLSLTAIFAGTANSLMFFALMRMALGICSSTINAPIY